MPETVSEGAQPAKGFTEPRFALDLRNPKGDLLHVRADSITEMVTNVNDLWDPQAGGDRSDITNLYLFSFHAGIVAEMVAGRTAEEAFGRELDADAASAYAALAQGATRQPAGAASNGGSRSGGGGGGGEIKKFKASEIGDRLPPWFADQLTRDWLCPKCRDADGMFIDNREEEGNLPTFKCANRDCEGSRSKAGKVYPWGVYEPDSKPAGSFRTR